MKAFRSIKLFVAALVLSVFGIQANAAPAGTVFGMTPAAAVAAGLGVIVGGVFIANELDDDDDNDRVADGGDGDGGDTPTTTTTAPAATATATTGT